MLERRRGVTDLDRMPSRAMGELAAALERLGPLGDWVTGAACRQVDQEVWLEDGTESLTRWPSGSAAAAPSAGTALSTPTVPPSGASGRAAGAATACAKGTSRSV